MNTRRVTYTLSMDVDVNPEELASVLAEELTPEDLMTMVLRFDQEQDLEWTQNLYDQLGDIIDAETEETDR